MENKGSVKPSLADLQKWMMWAITDPRGASTAVLDPAPADRGARYQAPINSFGLQHVRSDKKATSYERLDVYAEAYFARLVDVLSDDFPTVRKALGDKGFAKFIAEYLKAYPSKSPNVGEVGRSLPIFAATSEEITEFPYLADLCDLEWRVTEAFYAASSKPLDPQKLEAAPDGQFETASLNFDSAVQVIRSPWQIGRLWQDREKPGPPTFENSAAESILIFKHNGFIDLKLIDAAEAALAIALLSGQRLKDAAAGEFAKQMRSRTDIEAKVGQCLSSWLELGIVSDIYFTTENA